MKFGICMDGVEDKFEQSLIALAKWCEPSLYSNCLDNKYDHPHGNHPFVYLEIGTAYAETWLAVCQILSRTNANWRTIGIDPWEPALENYKIRIEPVFADKAILINKTREEAFRDDMELIGPRLDFVFIDGCHAKPCVMGDFLAVEPLVVPGGLVVFHDFGPQSSGMQSHCNQPLAVREATIELGLFGRHRPGWTQLLDWRGDKERNGATCGVFKKL